MTVLRDPIVAYHPWILVLQGIQKKTRNPLDVLVLQDLMQNRMSQKQQRG